MKFFAVSKPVETFSDINEVHRFIAEKNMGVLLGTEYPTSTGLFTAKDILKDPNYSISVHIAETLVQYGVLLKQPWLNGHGRQVTAENGKVWDYAWAEEDFSILPAPVLLSLSWDVRYIPGFWNVTVVEDAEMHTAYYESLGTEAANNDSHEDQQEAAS